MVLLGKRKILILISGVIFLSAPLVFTNLYFRHNYYQYANTVFFCFIITLFCISFIDNENKFFSIIGKFIILPLILLLFTNSYFSIDYKIQKSSDDQYSNFLSLTNFIKNNTDYNDIIIFDGFDWDARYAYYSERKALMREDLDVNAENFAKFLEIIRNKNLNVGAVVFNNVRDMNYLLELSKILNKNLNTAEIHGGRILLYK